MCTNNCSKHYYILGSEDHASNAQYYCGYYCGYNAFGNSAAFVEVYDENTIFCIPTCTSKYLHDRTKIYSEESDNGGDASSATYYECVSSCKDGYYIYMKT